MSYCESQFVELLAKTEFSQCRLLTWPFHRPVSHTHAHAHAGCTIKRHKNTAEKISV